MPPGAFWSLLGTSWNTLKAMRKLRRAFWQPFGSSWERLGSFLDRLKSVLGACWSVLEASLERLGSQPEHFKRYFGARKASCKQFTEILQNHQKHCKVLQKSRLGEMRNNENHAWGPQVGPSDWLWTAKVTPGDALGLQVELPKALGAAQGVTLELWKLWESPQITQTQRAAEVFPYLSGSPYD